MVIFYASCISVNISLTFYRQNMMNMRDANNDILIWNFFCKNYDYRGISILSISVIS